MSETLDQIRAQAATVAARYEEMVLARENYRAAQAEHRKARDTLNALIFAAVDNDKASKHAIADALGKDRSAVHVRLKKRKQQTDG